VIYIKQRKQKIVTKSFCVLVFYKIIVLRDTGPYGLGQVTTIPKDWFLR
jgi:hypothetical protein